MRTTCRPRYIIFNIFLLVLALSCCTLLLNGEFLRFPVSMQQWESIWAHESVETPEPVQLTDNFDKKPEVIIYSRTQKAGSKTLGLVFDVLAKRNKWNFVDPKMYTLQLKHEHDKNKFVVDLFNMPRPVIHRRHFYFLDIDRYKNASDKAVPSTYINTVREPLERQLSWFYYIRRGAHGDAHQSWWVPLNLTETFDECVEKGDPSSSCLYTWEQVRFFCGQDTICKNPSPEALDLAKHNLVHKHMAVGIMEDMVKFLEVLEMAHPRFFRNITGVYNEIAPPGDLIAHHVTLNKQKPTEKTIQIIKSRMGLDYEFYNFARQHFYKLYTYLKTTMTE